MAPSTPGKPIDPKVIDGKELVLKNLSWPGTVLWAPKGLGLFLSTTTPQGWGKVSGFIGLGEAVLQRPAVS